MDLINLRTYTYEELCKVLIDDPNIGTENFISRMSTLTFRPSIIIMWDCNENMKEVKKQIKSWIKSQNSQGRINYHFACQLEFEFEEDAMAFKLRWM